METSAYFLNDYSLYLHNSLRVNALAKRFVRITDVAQLQALIHARAWGDLPTYVLGEGSNTLFIGDYSGLILNNAIKGMEITQHDADTAMVTLGAGERWHDVVTFAVDQGLYGIENLALIPGTVGAAPIQNIGAYGVELKDVFFSLDAVDLQTGASVKFDRDACRFGYRDSVFKHEAKDRYCITQVQLVLSKHPRFQLDYYALQEKLADMDPSQLSLQSVSQAVIEIRRSKLPDPQSIPNAGSFFKNPVVSRDQFERLAQENPGLPCFPYRADQVKLPAAWLIEQCGWKGRRLGHVGVHDQQALVLVNHSGGDGEALLALAQAIQADVLARFAIELVPEVRIVRSERNENKAK